MDKQTEPILAEYVNLTYDLLFTKEHIVHDCADELGCKIIKASTYDEFIIEPNVDNPEEVCIQFGPGGIRLDHTKFCEEVIRYFERCRRIRSLKKRNNPVARETK